MSVKTLTLTPQQPTPYLRRARLGIPGAADYAKRRSGSTIASCLNTLSAAPELGSASASASEVSVKTLTLTPQQPIPYLRRARLGTPGRLNYAECRSDSNTIRYVCTIPAPPELGSASARASEVSVKTLTLTPQQRHTRRPRQCARASGLRGG